MLFLDLLSHQIWKFTEEITDLLVLSVGNVRAASLRVASLRVCESASLRVCEFASLRVCESTFGYS